MRVFVLLCSLVVTSRQGPVPAVSSVSNSESQGPEAPGRDVVTWNQSQHGKYNLQVSLKDVQIIAVLNSDYYDDDDSSDDYEYGYEDIVDESTTASTPVDTIATEDGDDESSLSVEVDGPNNDKNTTSGNATRLPSPLLTFMTDGKPENISQLPNDPTKRTKVKRPSSSAGKCSPGFNRDRGGRCRRVRKRRPSFFPFKFPGFAGFRSTRRQAEQRDHLSQGEAHAHS